MSHRNRTRLFAAAFAVAALAGGPAAFAQTAPPAQPTQDHGAHHPDGQAQASPATPPAPNAPSKPSGGMPMGMMGKGGMMCDEMKQDMKSMMSMMHDMMSMQGGMMPSQAGGALAPLKAELKITEAQAPLWSRFAEAWRSAAESMQSQHKQVMASAASTLPERLARRQAMLSSQLASLKTIDEALGPLYASLDSDQKKIVDKLRVGRMGMM